jgi:hypothetical protein
MRQEVAVELDDQRERRLRAVRIQRREQQAELEATLREAEAAGRTMADVLRDHGERGDRCGLDVGPHRLVGVVVHVGDEVARVLGGDGRSWDVAIERVAVVWRIEGGRAVHRVGAGHPGSLLARGRELAGAYGVVEVGRLDRPEPVRGRLVAVSTQVLTLDRGPAGPAGPVVVAWPVVAWLSEV